MQNRKSLKIIGLRRGLPVFGVDVQLIVYKKCLVVESLTSQVPLRGLPCSTNIPGSLQRQEAEHPQDTA